MTFYEQTIASLCRDSLLDPAASTLVVAGGPLDRSTLLSCNFKNVVISNLDDRMRGVEPFQWDHQDAENLTYADGSFDQVIVHAGLHHCRSPHRALAEMIRVAKNAVVVLEARDSLIMRLAVKLGLTIDYEVDGVVTEGCGTGGVQNSAVPNYIYRWTEREVEKTVASIDPTGPVNVHYFYGLRLPTARIGRTSETWRHVAYSVACVPVRMLFTLMPRQANCFAFWIGKPKSRWPWMGPDGRLSEDWVAQHFNRR